MRIFFFLVAALLLEAAAAFSPTRCRTLACVVQREMSMQAQRDMSLQAMPSMPKVAKMGMGFISSISAHLGDLEGKGSPNQQQQQQTAASASALFAAPSSIIQGEIQKRRAAFGLNSFTALRSTAMAYAADVRGVGAAAVASGKLNLQKAKKLSSLLESILFKPLNAIVGFLKGLFGGSSDSASSSSSKASSGKAPDAWRWPPNISEPPSPKRKVSITDLSDSELRGKRVLVRCDLNVPLEKGVITDDTRIRGSIATIKYLVSKGAKVLLTSHLGRPKGGYEAKFSLAPVAPRLSELLGQEVQQDFARCEPADGGRGTVGHPGDGHGTIGIHAFDPNSGDVVSSHPERGGHQLVGLGIVEPGSGTELGFHRSGTQSRHRHPIGAQFDAQRMGVGEHEGL